MIFPAVCFCKIFSRGRSTEQLVICLDHGFMIPMIMISRVILEKAAT